MAKPLDLQELKAFLGLLLSMGSLKLPKLQDYWGTSVPLYRTSYGNVMSRDRFRAIASALQVIDRARDAEWSQLPDYRDCGTYWKIGDYMKDWRGRITSMVSPGRELTIDEIGTISR